MEKCNQCGKTTLLPKKFSNIVLCGKCASLVNYSEWAERIFESKEDLIKKKEEVISLASNNEIKKEIIDSIKNYFDEYINESFITSYDGKGGQKIYIFEKYCIIKTKNESVRDSLADNFNSFDPKVIDLENDDDDDDELLSTSEKLSIASDLFTKGIIKKGLSTAVSLGVKEIEREKKAERKENAIEKIREKNAKKIAFQIIVGDEKIFFSDFYKTEIMTSDDSYYELIKFVPNDIKANDIYNCKYFFADTSKLFKSKEIKQKVVSIRNIINEQIKKYTIKEKKIHKTQDIQNDISVKSNNIIEERKELDPFNEIRKYKELLDEGIITKEEFEKKKKDLLNV